MVSFFKKKNYPKFWLKYLERVKEEQQISEYENMRFVVLDTETTGFDYIKDRILSIGAVAIKDNRIMVADSLEIYIEQNVFNKETVKIHGIRKHGEQEKISEKEAMKQFIKYLKGAVIIAHHTSFDVHMINEALLRSGLGVLVSKQLDTNYLYKSMAVGDPFKRLYSLDELCDVYDIPKHDRHTALGDALLTAYVFLKIISKYKRNKALNLMDLLRTNYQLSR